MANALAWRLKRLEAFREAAGQLMARPQLQRDVFDRGDPGADRRHQASGMDRDALRPAVGLCRAAPAQRARHVRFKQRTVWSLQEARDVLERLIGQAADWSRLDEFLIAYLVEPAMRATVFASSLAATLELVREGHDRGAPASGVRADLSAQARRAGAGGAPVRRGAPRATE